MPSSSGQARAWSPPGPRPHGRALRTGSVAVLIGTGVACARSADMIVRRSAFYMGTTVTISVVAPGESEGVAAIEKGFAEVARLEQVLSTYRPESELSRLNAQAGAGPVAVSADLFDVVQRARALVLHTNGAFNPLVGPAVRAWGIPDRPRRPRPEELEAIRPLVGIDQLVLSEAQRTVALSRPGMAFDPGGIGKGYAVDRVVEILRRDGIRAGLVAISGDMRAFGRRPDGAAWRVAIRHPRSDGAPIAVADLDEQALSTSGDYERFFELDGVRYHHILDPRDLTPVRGVASATVIAPTATESDAVSTAVFVMGAGAGLRFVAGAPHLSALFVDDEGRVSASSTWPGDVPQGSARSQSEEESFSFVGTLS